MRVLLLQPPLRQFRSEIQEQRQMYRIEQRLQCLADVLPKLESEIIIIPVGHTEDERLTLDNLIVSCIALETGSMTRICSASTTKYASL